ncbi:hypothetical protein AB3S75_013873 [Citrus x aurantiifolia]
MGDRQRVATSMRDRLALHQQLLSPSMAGVVASIFESYCWFLFLIITLRELGSCYCGAQNNGSSCYSTRDRQLAINSFAVGGWQVLQSLILGAVA